jgi:hypothetical protein
MNVMSEHHYIQELIAVYDDLSQEEQAQVEAHVGTCAACAALLEVYRVMERQLAGLADTQPDARFRSLFYERLELAGRKGRWFFRLKRVPGLVARTAVLTLIAALFISFWLAIREQGRQPGADPVTVVSTSTATITAQPPTVTPLPTEKPLLTATPILVWEMQQVQQLNNGQGRIGQVALAADGSVFAAAGGEQVQLWQTADWQTVGIWPMPSLPESIRTINSLALSPEGSQMAAGSLDYNGYVVLWQLPDRNYSNLLSTHGDAITGLAFSGDGSFLASGTSSNERVARLWRTADGTHQQQFTTDGIVNGLAFTADGQILAAGTSAGTVWLWQVAEGQLLESWTVEGAWVTAVALHEQVVVAGMLDGRIHLWRVGEREVWQEFVVASAAIRRVTFSARGNLLAAAAADGTVMIWQVEATGLQLVMEAETADAMSQVIDLTFTPEGLLIVTGLPDGTIEIWQAHS